MKPPSYQAFEEKNGTYSIIDVPIFSEVPKGEKNAPEDIGRAWLEKAIDAAALLEKQNAYLPPLHIGHHKPGENVTGAGHFRLRRVRAMQFDGTERYVLTADLVGLQKEAFDDIMLGKYPYRSVEINDWTDARINHLALLSHQEPFFKFPLLNGNTIQLEKRPAGNKQVASCDGKRALIFFCEAEPEDTVAKETTTPKGTRKALAERLQKVLPLFEEQDTGTEEAGEQLTAEEERLDAALSMLDEIESGKAEATDEEFDALCEEIEELADIFDGGEEPEADPEDDDASDDNPKPAELSKAAKKQAAKLAALEDKVETMEAVSAAEKTAGNLFAKAKAELAGYFLSPKALARFEKIAESGDEEMLDLQIEAHKEHASKEPVAFAIEQAASDPALKGLNLSPDAAERAIQLAADWDALKKRGLTSLEKKDFIAINLEAETASAQ